MKIRELLLEYNVYNQEEMNKQIATIAKEIPDPAVAEKFAKLLKREAVNNLAFLTQVHQLQGDAPEWAEAALDKGELYNFTVSLTLRDQLTHLVHYITSLIQDAKEAPSRSDPEFSFKNQRHLEARKILENLAKVRFNELVQKGQEYYENTGKKADVKVDEGTAMILDLGNGWRWLELVKQSAYTRENQTLKVCIGSHYKAGDGHKIIVLKGPEGAVVATRYDRSGNLVEIKGKQNRMPEPKYMPAVNKLLQHLKCKVIDRHAIGSAGYVQDEKTFELKPISEMFKPKHVAGLRNGLTLVEWTAPKDLTDLDANTSRFDVVRKNVIALSLNVTTRGELKSVFNIYVDRIKGPMATEDSTIALRNLLAEVVKVMKISSIGDGVETQKKDIFWKGTTPLTLDEFTVQQVESMKNGPHAEYMPRMREIAEKLAAEQGVSVEDAFGPEVTALLRD